MFYDSSVTMTQLWTDLTATILTKVIEIDPCDLMPYFIYTPAASAVHEQELLPNSRVLG